jgi:hypothetical protein
VPALAHRYNEFFAARLDAAGDAVNAGVIILGAKTILESTPREGSVANFYLGAGRGYVGSERDGKIAR